MSINDKSNFLTLFVKSLREGLIEAIKVDLEIKFGRKGLFVLKRLKGVDDIRLLKEIKREVLLAKDIEDFKKRVFGKIKNNKKH